MNSRSCKLYILLCALALLFVFSFSTNVHVQTKNYEKLFYMVDGKNGIESLKKNAGFINIIAPQSYTVQADLSITGSVSSEIKNIAKEHTIKIVPLIVNAGFSQQVIHKILMAVPEAQDKIITFMVTEALTHNYSGWQFDFEHMSYTDKDAYSRFVERTANAFKRYSLSLSIAAVARIRDTEDTDFYNNWSGVFDYARLATAVDFISIMTYDDPNSKGPTASMPFVESVYGYLKNKVPAEKLSLGVPFYYWGWSVSPFKRVRSGGTYERLQYLRSTFKTVEGFDVNLKVPYLKYVTGRKEYVVWHEDGRSFTEKIEFMKKNNLRGFSGWVLGLENPEIWDVLKKEH